MSLPLRFAVQPSLPEYLERVEAPCARADLENEWSRRKLERALRDGSVFELLPGLLIATTHSQNPMVRARAITLWNPRVVVTGALALHVSRRDLPAPQIADVIIERPLNVCSPAWMRVRSTTAMPPSQMDNQVRVTQPAYSLVEAWRRKANRDRRNTFYEAMWNRVCAPERVMAAVDRTPRVPQRAELLELAMAFQDGASSPLEVIAHREVFVGRAFDEFEKQAKLKVAGRSRIADMLHRRARLVVELDGQKYHGGPGASQADRIRDIDFASEGYVTIRFGWNDLYDRPAWCRDRVLDAVNALLRRAA